MSLWLLLLLLLLPVVGAAAASTTGRKSTHDSYFMATDKVLLSIMRKQGFGSAVSTMQLQRGDRVGIDSALMDLIMQGALAPGTIKFFVGEC
jgi:hypothetical protein